MSSDHMRRTGAHGALALGALLAVLLTACDEHRRMSNEMAVGLTNPEQRHPIGFASRPESLDVEVPPAAEGLSPNQHVDVHRFLARYKREAVGRLTISVPASVRERPSVAHSLQGIQAHVADAGIDYRLSTGARDQRLGSAPAIRIAYERPVAIPPSCDHWTENVGRNEARLPYPNFGCATQHNTAVMVDNARDLRQPQGEDPRSGERRSATWSSYVGASATKSDGDGDTSKKSPSPAMKK